MYSVQLLLVSFCLATAIVLPLHLNAEEAEVEDAIPAYDQTADNLNSCRRYIDKVRSLERQRSGATGSQQDRRAQEEQYEWQEQSRWLQTQRNMAEKLSWELQRALPEYEESGSEDELLLLNARYEALKAQLKGAGKSYRVQYDGPQRRQRGYKSALRQLK